MKNIILMSVIVFMLNGCDWEDSKGRYDKYGAFSDEHVIANEMINLNKNMERLIEIMGRK